MLRLLCFFKLTLHWDAGKRNTAHCGQLQYVLTVAMQCKNVQSPPPTATPALVPGDLLRQEEKGPRKLL